MGPELQKYYRILLSKKLASLAQEGQRKIQECQTKAARSGATGTGVYLMTLLATYCAYNIRRPFLGHLECLDEALKALSAVPSESDYDEILKEAETTFSQRVSAGHQFVNDVILRQGLAGGDYATPVVNAARSAMEDLKRDIELRKLEITSRRRQQVPCLRDEVFEQISAVNAQSRRVFGFPLFVTSEHKVLTDLGKAPSTEEELASCIQALGILLDQVNHDELAADLLKANRPTPQGSMNRLQQVLKTHQIDADSAVNRLRDLGRLRSLYPAHPNSPDTVAAAERLGLPLEPTNPVETWERILRILCESMKGLSEALSQFQ